MDILIRMLMAVLKDRKHKKQRRVLSTVLAAVVVFMTTYSLILPAITLEESTAETTDGIFLESADVSEADPADDDVDPSGELLLTDDAWEESAPASDGWEDGLIEDADWEENGELADIPDEPVLTDTGDEATPDGILEEATDAAEAEEDTQALSFTGGELTVRETLVSRQGGEDFLRLTYGAEARIPEDTVCSAQAFTPASSGAAMGEESSLAEKYEQAAREKAARDYPEWDKIEVRMFDLQLAANGQTVQAENALHAELTLAQPIRSEALLLLHFEDNEAQEELRRIHAGETAGASSVEVHLPEVMHDAEFIRNANGEVYKIRFASQTLNTFAVVIRGESEETENRKEETAHETEPLTEAGTEAGTEAAVETLTESTAAGDETEEAAETETGNVYAETEEATEAVTETASEATEEATEDTTESEESVGEGETESELEEQYPEVEFSDSTQYTQVKVYAPEGAFPEGTQMLLSDVEDDETIAAICDAALAENSQVQKVHAVDISFRNSRNEEIEPLLPIRVEMTAEKCAEVGSSSVSSSVVHVDDSGNATIVENAQKVEAEAEDEKDADKLEDVETIAFEAKEFSVYALVYTVDFEYSVNGKMYQFSLSGGEKIALSDLIEVLGIIGDTNNGEKAAFNSVDSFLKEVANVEFSDESLVKVTKNEAGNDWTLESLAPFDTGESLTITMKNGDVVTVKVTDAQGDPLDGALTSVSITGAYSDDGTAWEVQKEQNYKLSFSFEEIAGDPNKQINVDNAGGVYLTLPTEFSAMNIENQSLVISENGVALQGNTFSVRDGKLYLDLTEETKTKIRTGNAKFNIDITGSFTQSKENMEFSSTVKRDVTVREDHDLDINKSASYQGWDNRIKYVVTVKSTGYNKNISISDVISGSGVVLDDGANYGVTVSSSSGTSSTTIHADKKGFDTVISSLNDGETVTITYYGKPNDSVNGAEPSMSLTGNTATAKTGTVEKDAPAYVTNKISWDNISKSAGQSSGEGTEKTLPWTITVNSNKGKDMSGAVVKDQIASDNMAYDTTTPITVTVYEANPNDVWNDVQKDSFTVNWSQVTLSADQKSFEYTLPDTAGNYKYVISYNTKVTVPTDSISDVTVNNNSSVTKDGKTDTTGGTGSVGPAQNVDLKKSVEKVSGDTVEWEISFKVPTTGLSKAIITDTFPNEWLDDARYRDTLDSSYDITVQEMVNGELSALQKGDTYSIDTSSAEKVVITFSKSDGSAGMTGDESAEREIVIKLKTKFNETWLERKPADGHKNTVNLNDVITAEATANPSAEKSLTKTAKAVGKININGTEYPIYKYSLVITGLSGDTLEIGS